MPSRPQPPPSGVYEATQENPLHHFAMGMPEYANWPAEYDWMGGCLYLATGETIREGVFEFVLLRGIYRISMLLRLLGFLRRMDDRTRQVSIEQFDEHFARIGPATATQLLGSWKRRLMTPEAVEALTLETGEA